MYAFVNDRFVLAKDAVVPATDLAINRGYGVFDFFRTIGDKPVFLEDHLNRFFGSAAFLRLPVSVNKESLKSVLSELIHRNSIGDSGIRLTLTGGASADGYSIGEPNLIITQQRLPLVPDAFREQGIRLVSVAHQRPLPMVKSIDYLFPIWLHPFILNDDADDALYHDYGHIISECPRANIFAITADDRVITPAQGMLEGITRGKLLQLAAPYYQVEERVVTLAELLMAKEGFVTSTTKGVMPVAAINKQPLGNGDRSVSSHLAALLNDAVQRSIND